MKFKEKIRLRKIKHFISGMNTLRNPFIYGTLGSKNYHPDIDVFVQPQFAQKGEDLIIESLVNAIYVLDPKRTKRIRYLEIGANHPISSSSTFLFYAKGARGTLVEANPKLIPQLKAVRSEDVVVNAAVVATNSKIERLYISNMSELSSTRGDLIGSFPGATVVESMSVPAVNINDLFYEFWQDDHVNILFIDVEGKDFELLEESNLSRYKFDIIQIEPSDHLIARNRQRILSHLNQFGYQLLADTQVNMIFALRASSDVVHPSTYRFEGFGDIFVRDRYNSFDVFDTLIARRKFKPSSIFDELKKEFGEIIEQRLQADNGSRTLREIYDFCGLSETILQRELQLELAHCIPIQENIERVSDGDLLVSDTYLPKEFVLELLGKCGLQKRVGIYVSNSDKWSGVFWGEVTKKPGLHVGDNEISDFRNPKQFGVEVELSKVSEPTPLEHDINRLSHPIGYFVRECRLDATRDPIALLAIETNIPMLFVACSTIQKIGRRPVFLGRDCQTLSQIYRRHFGEAVYLPFSRMFGKDASMARQYLEVHTEKDDIVVDLVSTGATWSGLSIERDFFCLIFNDQDGYTEPANLNQNFSYWFRASELGGTTYVWELLNCADHGMLIGANSLDWGWLEFAKHELPAEFVALIKSVGYRANQIFDNYLISDLDNNENEVFKYCHELLKVRAKELEHLFKPLFEAEIRNIEKFVSTSSTE